MKPRLPLPTSLTVVVAAAAALCGCSSSPPADYNCVLKNTGDGGYATLDRGGKVVADPTSCHAPECNGSFDGGYGMLVYRAPNGDEAPNCMV
jgi:hypothetical protein